MRRYGIGPNALLPIAALAFVAIGLSAQTPQRQGWISPKSVPHIQPTTIMPQTAEPRSNRLTRRPEIFFCQSAEPTCRTSAETFFIEELRDLFVFVTWPNLVGKHVQVVEFILPDGHLYERKRTAFTIRQPVLVSPAQPKALPPRRGTPIEAQAPDSRGTSQPPVASEPFLTWSRGDGAVITVLPVAGTFITQHNLVGTWTVRVLLDGQLALTANFRLKKQEVH